MKFNINDNVRVQLTPYGREVHKEYWGKILKGSSLKYILPNEDENGWSTWQLWDLMATFGPGLRLGFETPFKTEIEICEN